jgi:Tfp pilus assembly protein PilO
MQLEDKKISEPWKDFFLAYYRPIALVVALLVLFLGYWFILQNRIADYQSNYLSLQNLNSSIKQGNEQLLGAKDFSAKLYQPTADDRRLFEMVLPDKPDSSALIEQFTTMAKRAGFTVQSIDLEDVNGNKAGKGGKLTDAGKVLVNLKLTGGSYEGLKNLVALTESSIMLTEITSINFSSKSPVFEMSLIVYYYKPNSYATK